MKSNRLFYFALVIIFITSCTNIAKGLLMPNQCKRCEVYNTYSGNVITTYQGCGASNVRLEESAKVYAFDLMKSEENCSYNVRCTTWTQEPPAE